VALNIPIEFVTKKRIPEEALILLSQQKDSFGQAAAKKYTALYRERIGYLNAELGYRRDLFHFLREEAARNGLTFSLCMEFKEEDGKVTGLNEEFSTSYNCEGKDVPLYRRRGERFYPIAGCRGNCLRCDLFACGLPQFYHSTGKTCYALTLKDYRYTDDHG